eukprot:CAMPEP_0201530486 /NCGR_PEP_ID=MMETSP0161_2-20130828/44849_1 /ASSEMBLY_ACC=CAM_ASM_000251 /TAXON_ID=180227 /ORGANISM="Neoparamoeba aestuarina, Strain SoJaBio B1-5/56/2" /LENGTH=92 /DNA_ID=CAMNT_0047932875 /DNA_START=287 /DNA_END=562 /DNA_ORIENTATION=-
MPPENTRPEEHHRDKICGVAVVGVLLRPTEVRVHEVDVDKKVDPETLKIGKVGEYSIVLALLVHEGEAEAQVDGGQDVEGDGNGDGSADRHV